MSTRGIRYLFDTEGMMTPVENIHPHPDNDNNGDVDEIVASMMATGVYRPIYVSRATGNIVAGHHVWYALQELGAKFVPVEWIDVDEHGELRILAADNKIARNARPEADRTAALLQRLIATSPVSSDPAAALVGTGYSERERDLLLRKPTPLDLSSKRGQETLEHRIKCPECGHTWTRSGPSTED